MKNVFLAVLMALFICGVANAAAIDVKQFPTSNFVDPSNPSSNYRWFDQDWGWTHNAISGSITSATLNIGAWDVDYDGSYDGEWDIIYAYNNGVKTALGHLDGHNNEWAYTSFILGSEYFDDINSGLQVFMNIDANHEYDYWAVSLSKSALSVDGGVIPNPEPGNPQVPEPATMALLGSLATGLFGITGLRRRFTK